MGVLTMGVKFIVMLVFVAIGFLGLVCKCFMSFYFYVFICINWFSLTYFKKLILQSLKEIHSITGSSYLTISMNNLSNYDSPGLSVAKKALLKSCPMKTYSYILRQWRRFFSDISPRKTISMHTWSPPTVNIFDIFL